MPSISLKKDDHLKGTGAGRRNQYQLKHGVLEPSLGDHLAERVVQVAATIFSLPAEQRA